MLFSLYYETSYLTHGGATQADSSVFSSVFILQSIESVETVLAMLKGGMAPLQFRFESRILIKTHQG